MSRSTRTYDLIAVGGGTGGLVAAAGAAYLGLKSAIIEKEALGGDCLWTGCVPSKALIASARLAHQVKNSSALGFQSLRRTLSSGVRNSTTFPSSYVQFLLTPQWERIEVDFHLRENFRHVMERMRQARSTVARHDDPKRFREMGVGVHFGRARFLDGNTVEVDGEGRFRSKRIVIATGAVASVPPVPGLEEAGYWTYENVFDQNELPESIAVLGGGPVGLEFAQLFSRLGARVTVLEMASAILVQEDADASSFLQRVLEAEGIAVRTGAAVKSVRVDGDKKIVETDDGKSVTADQIFAATGRRPCTDGMELEAAGVRTERGAVRVDDYLQTSAKSVWAAGDVTGGLQFTHAAEHMAKAVLRNAAVPGKAKIRYDNVPWVTYTDPEVARVGMGEDEAAAAGGTAYRYEMNDLDRAIVDGAAAGFVKVSADRKGKVLGATIVAHGAGELILPLVMARQHGLTLAQVANTVFPYPTMTEGVKRAAGEYMRARLGTAAGRTLKRVIQWMK